jgi:hypothetical protein
LPSELVRAAVRDQLEAVDDNEGDEDDELDDDDDDE